jgi:hypothetical protein
MKRKLQALAAAVLGGVGSIASAAPVNIGGLNLETGPIFLVSSVYENVVTAVGDTLSGVGEITQINGEAVGDLCAGCELTFVFGGYTVTSLTPTDITFTGGTATFYLGFGADNDFNPFASGGSAADLAAASNGVTFLNLVGHDVDALGNTFLGGGVNLGTAAAFGRGLGLADVDLSGTGIANTYFDTNGVQADFGGGNADLGIGSVFGSVTPPHTGECTTGSGPECLAGSANFQGNVIPEPETYALMLAGLGVIGYVSRRRRKD